MTRPASGLTYRLEAPLRLRPTGAQDHRHPAVVRWQRRVGRSQRGVHRRHHLPHLRQVARRSGADRQPDLRHHLDRDTRGADSAASTKPLCWVPNTSTRLIFRRPTRVVDIVDSRADGDHRMSQATAAALAVTAARTADDKKAERTLVLVRRRRAVDHRLLRHHQRFQPPAGAHGRRRDRDGRAASSTAARRCESREWPSSSGCSIDYGDAVIHVFSDEIRAVLRDRAPVPRRAQDRLAGRRR